MSVWYAEGVHAVDGGHLIRSHAVVPGLRVDRDDRVLWVGQSATVQAGIHHAGSVVLGRATHVQGAVRGGHEVVLGAGARVDGPVTARGRIVVQAGATVEGDLEAGSDVLLLGRCHVGTVRAQGDIVVVGEPEARGLEPGGRIQTRPW